MPFGKAFAAMQVNNVSGTVADGASITIQGSGFGNNGPTIVLFDNFESGTVGQNLKTGAGSATIGQWLALNQVPPKYSNVTSVSGSNAWSVTAVQGVEGKTNAYLALPGTTEEFLSWWCYVPSSSPWPGEGSGSDPANNINWKVMWFADGTAGNWTGTSNDADIVMLANSSQFAITGNRTPLTRWFSSNISKGSWHRYWAWIKDGSNGDGTVKIWELRNSGVTLLLNATNVSTVNPGGVRNQLSVNGYTRLHNSGTMPTQMFDDVYVAAGPNAQARVEIGNNSNYDQSTKLAIATVTSWSDTSIKATVRRGSFQSGENAYLFVVDANGNVSSGRAVTIGGTASGGSTTLPAPAIASITIK